MKKDRPGRGFPSSLLPRLRDWTAGFTLSRVLIIACSTLAVFFICSASVTPARYDLSVGMVPTLTIAANKDVVDEIMTAQNRELAAAAVTPSYRFQEGVTERVLSNLSSIEAELALVRRYALSLPGYAPSRKYSQAELEHAQSLLSLLPLRDYQLTTLMNAQQDHYDEMISSLKAAVKNSMQGNVTQGQEAQVVNSALQFVGFRTNVSLLQNIALPMLQKTMEANMVVDQAATDAARQAARDAVEPVIFKRGQNIVVRGEGRVRENQIAMLSSLGLLQRNEIDYRMYLGALALVLLVMAAMSLAVKAVSPGVHESVRDLSVLHLVFLAVLLLSLLVKSAQVPFLAPLALASMLLTILIGYLPALIANAAVSIISALMLGGVSPGSMFDMISILIPALLSGTAAALMLKRNQQRPAILVTGLAVSGVSFFAGLGIALIMNSDLSVVWERIRYVPLWGLASALLCLALQPAFESAFNLPTPSRLLDLGNPNRPLLKRLLMEAPGTYHHSIIIANLAEASAEAIEANALLARTAAYYHDVGKLKRPLYFKENQIGEGNIHDRTEPQVSAAIITSHVRDGVTLARQYRLPREIRQIIEQHHGDSLVSYFYVKAISETNGAGIDGSEFRYEGIPPETAEGAIIMICDTIEAAVRTLTAPSAEDIDRFIGQLIDRKVSEGQLRNAPLTLRDLHRIQKACSKVIHGVFHERIEYPSADSKPPSRRYKIPLPGPVQGLERASKTAAQGVHPEGKPPSSPPGHGNAGQAKLSPLPSLPNAGAATPPDVLKQEENLSLNGAPRPDEELHSLRVVRPEEFAGKESIQIVEPPRPHRPVTVDEMIPPENIQSAASQEKAGQKRNGRGG